MNHKQALFVACLPIFLFLIVVDLLIEHLIINRRYKPIKDDSYGVKYLMSVMMHDIHAKYK